ALILNTEIHSITQVGEIAIPNLILITPVDNLIIIAVDVLNITRAKSRVTCLILINGVIVDLFLRHEDSVGFVSDPAIGILSCKLVNSDIIRIIVFAFRPVPILLTGKTSHEGNIIAHFAADTVLMAERQLKTLVFC